MTHLVQKDQNSQKRTSFYEAAITPHIMAMMIMIVMMSAMGMRLVPRLSMIVVMIVTSGLVVVMGAATLFVRLMGIGGF